MKPIASQRAQSLKRGAVWELVDLANKLHDRTDQVRLSIGEPDYDTPEHVRIAAQTALQQGFTHYAPDKGIPELREAIAEKLNRDSQIDVDLETGICLTIGTSAANAAALLAFVNPGDEVITISPHYPAYQTQTTMAGGKLVIVKVTPDTNFCPNPDDIAEAITPRSKVLMLLSPNNPTGAVYDKDCLEAIADLAQKKNLVVISDEVYEHFVYDDAVHTSIASIPGMFERTIITNSFSKTYAMTGWRLGFVAGHSDLISQVLKCHYAVNLSASSFVEKAAVAALTGPQTCVEEMIAEYNRRRNFVVKELNKISGISCHPPKGAFYTFPDMREYGKTSWELAEYLIREVGVLTRPGSEFGEAGEGFLRISFATSMEQLERGMKRMKEALESL